MPGGLPLTERLERAFAGRVADLPDATRLVLLVAALSDEDAVSEILQAAGAVAGAPLDLDVLEPAADAALIDLDVNSIRFRHPLVRSAVRQSAGVQQRRRVHEALAATLHADPDRRVWHRAALMSGTHEELARRARGGRGARAAPGRHRRRRDGAAAGGAAQRPDAIEPGACSPPPSWPTRADDRTSRSRCCARSSAWTSISSTSRERASSASCMDARALVDRSRVADLIATAEQAGAAGDRELHHNLLWIAAARTWWASPGPDDAAARRGRRRSRRTAHRGGSAVDLDPRLRRSARQRADGPRLPARRGGPRRDGCGARGLPGLGRDRHRRVLRQPDVLHRRDRERPRRRAPRCPAPPARHAGDPGRSPARLGHRDPRRRGGAPAGDRARPAHLARHGRDGDRDDRGRPRRPGGDGARDRPAEQIALPLGAHHIVALAQSGPILSALARGHHAEALRFAERLFDPRDPAHHLQFACMAIGDLAEAAALAGRAPAARERLAEVEALVGDAPAEWIAINLRHARAMLAEDEREGGRALRGGPRRGSRSLAVLARPAAARPRPVAAPPPAHDGLPRTVA